MDIGEWSSNHWRNFFQPAASPVASLIPVTIPSLIAGIDVIDIFQKAFASQVKCYGRTSTVTKAKYAMFFTACFELGFYGENCILDISQEGE